MSKQALLIELMLSGFFAIACFRARTETSNSGGFAPQRLLVLTNRLERLRRTRWQWATMVLLLVVVRLQLGAPILIELTALAQFIVFIALPSEGTRAGARRL